MAVAKKRPVSKGKAAVKKTVKKKAAPEKKAPARKTAHHAAAKTAVKKKAVAPKKASAKASAAAIAAGQTTPYLDGIEPYQEKKGEAYMNPNQVAHFRKILHAWKGKLIEEMERTVTHMRDEAANFPDPNDRASQESDFALELRTRDRERKLIKKIDESLRDLDNEDYGYCEVCGVEIGIRRLEARPTANLCIDCKTLDEIRERQIKG